MEYTQIHDYLVKNENSLKNHHMHFLAWLKAHDNFLVGIEKYFLMLRSELSEFVHTHYPNLHNRELIDDYADKSHFKLLENKENSILKDIKMFRAMCKERNEHDLNILDYVNKLEIQCLMLSKYIRPELA